VAQTCTHRDCYREAKLDEICVTPGGVGQARLSDRALATIDSDVRPSKILSKTNNFRNYLSASEWTGNILLKQLGLGSEQTDWIHALANTKWSHLETPFQHTACLQHSVQRTILESTFSVQCTGIVDLICRRLRVAA